MPTIFDNLTETSRLHVGLRTAMDGANRLDACVGYFNLRGWGALAQSVDRLNGSGVLPPCRVLIGMQEGPAEHLRALYSLPDDEPRSQSHLPALEQRVAEDLRKQLTIGFPTNATEAALRRLARQLRDGRVQIKVFLRHQLHAKLYLVHRPDVLAPVAGYVGSSNLTFAGLQSQGELNVDVLEQDAAAKLQRWFDDRWQDDWSRDISLALADIIETSWAQGEIAPYLVYLKMAYHLSRDARAGTEEFRIPRDMEPLLFNFQKSAVQIAAKHLHQRGGVLIGDVVGLGKTLMATALARVFQEDMGTDTLVICPKNLVSMWKHHFAEHRVLGEVMSASRALSELPDLRRYSVVLIDESHNLRNREGRVYRAIRDYIERNESRVILLSATPYNKTFLDLGAQLGLFLGPEEQIGVRPETYIQSIGDAQFTARHQCEPRTLRAFEHSTFPEDWRRLMRRYMVRRTRRFIIDNHTDQDAAGRAYLTSQDGKRFYFPVRKPVPLPFAFEPGSDDPYPRFLDPQTIEQIDGLLLPRYGLGNYVLPNPRKLTPDEKERIAGLSRAGIRLKGFCRTNLFKRLESGGPAFLQSVERHLLRNWLFVHAIDEGLPLPIAADDQGLFDTRIFDRDPDAADASIDDLLADPDADPDGDGDNLLPETNGRWNEQRWRAAAAEVYAALKLDRRGARRIASDLFSPDLRRDLLADIASLQRILDHCGRWNPAADRKLAALADLIQRQHPGEKVLVFTQFADTVDYLARELPARGVTDCAGVTAAARNPAELAWRFSPASNHRKDLVLRDGELRVLVATDVLSEGQNLQDCRIIINYDLPWAIIRLIQRAGRVDRIGQDAEEILCYSFLPADGLEEIIRLRSRLRDRLKANGEVVGSDESFFDDDPTDDAIHDIYAGKDGLLDETGDALGVDPTSEALQIWTNAIAADPGVGRAVEALPDVVYSARAIAPAPHLPPGVLVYVRDGDGNDDLRYVGSDGALVTDSAMDVLRVAACHPDTPAAERDERHHDLVKGAIEQMARDQRHLGGQLGKPSGARYRAYHRLRDYVDKLRQPNRTLPMFGQDAMAIDHAALGRALDDLLDRPLTGAATDSLNRLLKVGASDDHLARRVLELRDDGRLTIPREESGGREPQIVCSLGLVAD